MKGYRRKTSGCPLEDNYRLPGLREPDAVVGAVVMAVAAVVSGVMQYKQAQSAAKKQKQIAEMNAQRIAAEKAEQLRKMKLDQARTLSQAQAAAAASGVTVEGSQKSYIEQMRESFKAEQDWLQSASQSQQAITRASGALEASMTAGAGRVALVQGIGKAGGAAYSAWGGAASGGGGTGGGFTGHYQFGHT